MARVTRFFEKIGLVSVGPEAGEIREIPVSDPNATDAALGATTPSSLAEGVRVSPAPVIPPERFEGSSASSEPDISFDDIYARAGVKPPAHGFTVDKLIEMMNADEFKGTDRPTMAKMISGMLKLLPGGPVPVEDIVMDATARDAALDAFERFMANEAAKIETQLLDENRALQDEIDRIYQANNEKMAANRTRIQDEKNALESWRRKKEAEENRLFDAVRPFVNENPITRGPAGAAGPAGASPAAASPSAKRTGATGKGA
jgi:hypothetical protein